MHYYNEKLYIYDRSLMRLSVINTMGELINSFSTRNQAIEMVASENFVYLYTPFSNRSNTVSKYNINNGDQIKEFGEISEVHVRLRSSLRGTSFQGIEVIDDKIYVLSHPYDLRVEVFDFEGNLISTFKPESDIYQYPIIPSNFNPFRDIENISDYIKSSVLRFYSNMDNLYIIQAHFETGDHFLDIYKTDGSRVNGQSININNMRPHKISTNGIFYMLFLVENNNESMIEIRKYRLI